MSLKRTIWLMPALVALVFVVGAAIAGWISRATSSSLERLSQVEYPYLEAITQLGDQFVAFENTLQNSVAEGEEKGLEDVSVRSAAMQQLAGSAKQLAPEQAGDLPDKVREYTDTALMAARQMMGKAGSDTEASVSRMQASHRHLAQRLPAMQLAAKQAVTQQLRSADSGVRAGSLTLWFIAIAVVGMLAAGAWWTTRSVWQQLGGEPGYAREVLRRVARGDLAVEVQVEPGASTSLLAALRDMTQGLSDIVLAVRRGSDSMATASCEIAAGSNDLSVRTEQTASNLQSTSASVDQLASAVRQTAGAARSASGLAGEAADVARRGGEVVSQVVSTMGEINKSSRRIFEIIGVIDGIAFQTNILALNAAVEAARAGEHGRGFAVVASEVRSLAQRSASAAKEIKTLIVSSVENVEAGGRLVRDAGATMDEIVKSVSGVNQIIAEIASAAADQDDGVTRVNNSVSQLDEVTQQNAALVEQSAASAESLQQQAAELTRLVAAFEIRAGGRRQP